VRAAGVSLVRSVIPRLSSESLVRYLELAIRLTERVRVDEDLWRSVIEGRLCAIESQEALWKTARDRSNSSQLRRSAFEYLMLGEPTNVPQVLTSALADPDPRVGLWALAQTKGLALTEHRHGLLKVALVAKHAAVRRVALRQYASLNTDDCNQTLRTALFDPARGVRNFAAFELEQGHGESALPIWRAALDEPRRYLPEVAAIALCESGEQKDVEHVASDGRARNAVLRAAVLRGLWRVGSHRLNLHLPASASAR